MHMVVVPDSESSFKGEKFQETITPLCRTPLADPPLFNFELRKSTQRAGP
jgi:hypothetical protein